MSEQKVNPFKFEPGETLRCVTPVKMPNGDVIIQKGDVVNCAGNTYFPDGSFYIQIWGGTTLGTIITTEDHFELENIVDVEAVEVEEEGE